MIKKNFKEVFELSKKLQEKNYRKIYDKLAKSDKNIGSFDDFFKEELNKFNGFKSTKSI